MPADYGLAVGRYSTVIYIQNEYGGVYTTIPVTINVGEAVVTHTVTFKVDGSAVDTKTVESGKTVTAPADPSQSGKKFVGWYTDDNVKFDFATPITGDLTLNAKFEDVIITHSEYGFYAVIYTKNDLTFELIGNNTLTQTKFYSAMIYVDGANLTVGGDGKLKIILIFSTLFS